MEFVTIDGHLTILLFSQSSPFQLRPNPLSETYIEYHQKLKALTISHSETGKRQSYQRTERAYIRSEKVREKAKR